jgi:hypothetical protein
MWTRARTENRFGPIVIVNTSRPHLIGMAPSLALAPSLVAYGLAFSVLLLCMGIAGCRSTNSDERTLLGNGTADSDQLNELAKQRGVDLNSKIQSICAGNTNAMADVFKFSLTFTSLDNNARSYGEFVYDIYGTLMKIARGCEMFVWVVAAQNSEVRQRVRDFLYYSIAHEATNGWTRVDKEIREDFPNLFPPDYRFGDGDPLFKR